MDETGSPPRNPILTAALAALALVAWPGAAAAYRPFDGTDAAVAEPGELEVELGPAGLLREGSQRTLIAPALVLNLGLLKGWEAVLEGAGRTTLPPDGARSSVVGNGAFLKGVLREGVLQEKTGPSIATEFGALLPGINGEPGTGASWAAIVSQRFSSITAHLNLEGQVTRQGHGDAFLSTIVEGPTDWEVRPVAELVYEREFGGRETVSGLVGAIWQVRDGLALDAGLREGRVDDRSLTEIRIGVTFAFPLWRGRDD